MRAHGAGAVVFGIASAISCTSAEVGGCPGGLLVRDVDGQGYCVYEPDEVPRDAAGDPRCPRPYPVLTELPNGLVCASHAVDPQDLPELLAAALTKQDAGADGGPDDASAREPDAAVPPIGCTLGPAQPLGSPRASSDGATIVGLSTGGFAVAWAGTVEVLAADGAPVSSLALEAIGRYGLDGSAASLVVARMVTSAEGQSLSVLRVADGFERLIPAGSPAADAGGARLVAGDRALWVLHPSGSGWLVEALDGAMLDPVGAWAAPSPGELMLLGRGAAVVSMSDRTVDLLVTLLAELGAEPMGMTTRVEAAGATRIAVCCGGIVLFSGDDGTRPIAIRGFGPGAPPRAIEPAPPVVDGLAVTDGSSGGFVAAWSADDVATITGLDRELRVRTEDARIEEQGIRVEGLAAGPSGVGLATTSDDGGAGGTRQLAFRTVRCP